MRTRICFYCLIIAVMLALAACQPLQTPASPTDEPMPSLVHTPTSMPMPTNTTAAEAAAPSTPTPPEVVETPAAELSPTPLVPIPEMPAPDGSLSLFQVAQHGGEVTSVAAGDGYAYAGFGASLITFRLNDKAPPDLIGEPFSLNFLARDLALQGGFLYLLDGEGHLFLFDVSDAQYMYVVQAFEGAGTGRIFVSGDWGLTTRETCREGICTSQVELFSLEGLAETEPVFGPDEIGPSLPVQASLEIPGSIQEVYIDGGQAFIAHSDGLLAVSLPGLEVLDELKADYISGAAFAFPWVYLSGNEFMIVDLSNPQALEMTKTDPIMQTGAPLVAAGERLYGFDTFGEFGLCWSTLQALNVEDPAAPAANLDETVPQLTCVSRVEDIGDTLLVIDWEGLHFLDISDPDHPRLLYSYANVPGALEIVQDGWAFGGSDRGPTSLWTHDLRDLEDIQSYGPFAPRWAIRLQAAGKYLFAPVWEDGLAVLDVSQPEQPALVAELPVDQTQGPGLDAALVGETLYLARGEGGLGVFDISDPANPSLSGGFTPDQAEGAWQRTVRVAAGEDSLVALEEVWEGDLPAGLLRIFNRQDPNNPEPAGEIQIEAPFLRSDLESDGQSAYFMGSLCQTSCSHQIMIVDLADTAEPAVLASMRLPGEAFDIHISGGFLYVAAGLDGVFVWSVSDPTNPRLAAHAGTPGPAERVVVEGARLYVSGKEAGLMVFQID